MSTDFGDPTETPQADALPERQVILYSYGGCTSCGNSVWNWLAKHNIKAEHHNVQINYEKQAATELAMAQGYSVREVSFPLFVVNGKVIIGLKPNEILAELES